MGDIFCFRIQEKSYNKKRAGKCLRAFFQERLCRIMRYSVGFMWSMVSGFPSIMEE